METLGTRDKAATSRKARPTAASHAENKEPLSSEISKFWKAETLPDDFFGEVTISSVPAVLPKRLGSFPFWRGEERFLDAMESIYRQASSLGLNVFLGEKIDEQGS
jgi:uncharacterized Zn finger protein